MRRRSRGRPLIAAALLGIGCRSTAPAPLADAGAVPEASGPRPAGSADLTSKRDLGVPCAPPLCRQFASPVEAFQTVLAVRSRVLAIGEAHAQQGTEPVESATARFTRSLLPLMRGRATDIVIELWVARGGCGAVERDVAARQAPVAAPQARGNQQEFSALGRRAKALGIRPHALEPSCDEYRAIARAGEADIARMLETVATTTRQRLEALLTSPSSPDAGHSASQPLILAYGGALHNDADPKPGREAWSFGPALKRTLGDDYVELDLFVPEQIKDTEPWRALPWYRHFDGSVRSAKTTLIQLGHRSFVLIFGWSSAATAPGTH
jgi:hypothetical protein